MREFLFIWEGNDSEWGTVTDDNELTICKESKGNFYNYIQKELIYYVLESLPDKTFKTIKDTSTPDTNYWDKETKQYMIDNNLLWENKPFDITKAVVYGVR